MSFGLSLGLGLSGFTGQRSGDEEVPETKYLFIDGGCLRAERDKFLEQFSQTAAPLTLNLRQLASGFTKAFYYDAISARDYQEPLADYEARVEKEHEQFDQIRALDGFHVSLGEIKGKKNRRQKRVDVQLAVDMLTHSFRRNMQSVTLLAGDDDFIPLIEALVREGMKITIWHPERASRDLLGAADTRRPFNLETALPFFVRRNHNPAFYISNQGGVVTPPSGPNVWMWNEDDVEYRAEFPGNNFGLFWRSDGSWRHMRLSCPGSSVEDAILAMSLLSGKRVQPPT